MKSLHLGILFVAALSSACASMGDGKGPVPRTANVVIQKYSGSWFIIAAIPLSIEDGAYDPLESYVANPDGTIATVFQFRKKAFDGELVVKPIVSEIVPNTNNAEWQVQTIWPLKNQYVISHLESDYSSAIVGRDARDHVWILSRTPTLSAQKIEEYKGIITRDGYDVSKLVMFPQSGQRPMP